MNREAGQRLSDRMFIRFCRTAALDVLRIAHEAELEADEVEEWRLIALERAIARATPKLDASRVP